MPAIIDKRAMRTAAKVERLREARNVAMGRLAVLDKHLNNFENDLAALKTEQAAAEGKTTQYMPSSQLWGDATDSYLSNPFEGLSDEDRLGNPSEKDCFALEAAEQLGGMKYLDGDCTIVAFTVSGLTDFIRAITASTEESK